LSYSMIERSIKSPFSPTRQGSAPVFAARLTCWKELVVRGALTEDQYRHLRYRLRAAGALLIPINADEIVLAAMRNRQNEAPEFRAIRDGLELARISEMPQFPGEMRWFMSYVQAVKAAIMRIWNTEAGEERARILSSQIFDLGPLPENWVGRWNGQTPPNWTMAVRRSLIGSFALPVEIMDRAKVKTYQTWFEETLMSEVRTLSPEIYQQVIDYLRQFMLTSWDDNASD